MLENTREYIDYVFRSNFTEQQALEELMKVKGKFTNDEKNFIYCYCFPRPLLDRELMSRVAEFHRLRGDTGLLYPNVQDITLILEAGRTEQYGRFIKHLMHAFCDEENIYRVPGADEYECPICGKKTHGLDLWDSQIDVYGETLAIGSSESSVTLCLNCLVQLSSAKDLINFIDPSFLDWMKRYKINKTRSRKKA